MSSKKEMVHVYLSKEEKSEVEKSSKKLGISTSSYIKVKLFSEKLILFFIFISVFSSALSENVGAADNASLNYVWNESCTTDNALCWIPWYATSDGQPKIYMDLMNITAENASLADSLLTNYIFPYTLSTINLENITVLKDVTILGTLYGGSPLKIAGDLNLSGNLSLIDDSLLADYIYPHANPVITLKNISILQDLRVLGTLYGDGSQLTGISAGGMDYTNIAMLNSTSDQTFVGNVSFADNLTVGNNVFYVDSSNSRIGIGTTSPSDLFNIYSSTNDNIILNISEAGSTGVYINATSMGIGTSTPHQSLHVIGTNAGPLDALPPTMGPADIATFENNGTTNVNILSHSTGNSRLQLGNERGRNLGSIEYIGSGDYLYLGINSSAKLVVATDGNVGIGTTTPIDTLSVYNSNPGGSITFLRQADGAVVNWRAGANIGDGHFYIAEDNNLPAFDATDTVMMMTYDTHRVGIGTTSPTHALNVVGDINATGLLYYNGGTQATDYVFTFFFGKENCVQKKGEEYCDTILAAAPENYSLLPLSDLKDYLQNQNHLPGLPGKKLVGQVQAGEINNLLLEKLEEQALYIIQLKEEKDKEIQQLKQIICKTNSNEEICQK